jgi:hypothetical protein
MWSSTFFDTDILISTPSTHVLPRPSGLIATMETLKETERSWKLWRKLFKNTSIFKHQPLEKPRDIRVLHLLSEKGETLKCRIEHVDLDSAEYTALSYEWGSSEHLSRIKVMDVANKTIGHLPLTRNLYSALCDLRDSPQVTTKTFWIDQISINQLDRIERGHQVDLMGEVYKNASQVISYLGPAQPDDQEGFELLERINRQYKHLYYTPELNEDDRKTSAKYQDPSQIPESLQCNISVSDPRWPILWEIVVGPWTRRLWMVQETCMNEKGDVQMLRGGRLFPWIMVGAVAQLNYVNLLPDTIAFDKLFVATWIWQMRITQDGNSRELAALLSAVSPTMECQDKRDRIFALLGLSSDAEELGIQADYTKKYHELLLDVAVRMMTRQNMRPLGFCNPKGADDSLPLPSWVPRWNELDYILLPFFDASGDLETAIEFSPDFSIMKSPGVLLGKVTKNTGEFVKNLHEELTLSELIHLENVVTESRHFLMGQTTPDSSISTVLCGRTSLEAADGVVLDAAQSLVATMKLVTLAKYNLQGKNSAAGADLFSMCRYLSKSESVHARALVVLSPTGGRAICFTDNGQICLTPGRVEAGDILVILQGGNGLYVLRPRGDHFLFVGDAYMHGVMEGEAVSEPDWEEKLQTFSII